jgi:hypothetical protein
MRPPKTTAGPVCLWSSRHLPGVGAYFDFVGTSEKLSYTDHVRCIVWDHTQIKCGGCMACWSGFPLQGVHRFEAPLVCDSHHVDNLMAWVLA